MDKEVLFNVFVNASNYTLPYIDVTYNRVLKTKTLHEVTKIVREDFSIPSVSIIMFYI